MAFALFADSISNFSKWREIILSLGVKGDIPYPKIAKCYAKTAIAERRTNIKKNSVIIVVYWNN